MKHRDLIKHLRAHGCEEDVDRSGRGPHDVWKNTATGQTAAIPRKVELKNPTAWAICKELGVPVIRKR
jgi:hypothetical protein